MSARGDRWPAFESRMQEIRDLDGVAALLAWDEETCAPSGSHASRGRQLATLEAVRHQRLVDPTFRGLLEELAEAQALNDAERVMVRRMRRRSDLAARLPEPLVRALAEVRSNAIDAWQRARSERRFAAFAPHLSPTFRLLREKADALGYTGERYDALLDEHEPEMTTASLLPVLAGLRAELVPLVQALLERGRPPDRSFLAGPFDVEAQRALSLRLVQLLGFDLTRGRVDRSTHPFSIACSGDDVRLTTRFYADDPLAAIYVIIHEVGHGLYVQGFRAEHHRTPLAELPSAGIDESQARLWENMIGRSLPFWEGFLPLMREHFPAQLAAVGAEQMFRAANTVRATPIRTASDELTYNLHILLRVELERALLDGALPIAELPAAWRDRARQDLGVTPRDDAEGCLQDIHWAQGAVGYFPTYTLGNLYAAQLMATYERQHPEVWSDVAAARHAPLLAWLGSQVYSHGYLDSAQATVRRVVGADLQVGPFVRYLGSKYRALYSL